MSLPGGLEVESYSDAIADAIGDARVTHALFTTFTLDPGFFELHGLPLLLPDRSFSHIDKARRIQLEQGLRMGPQVAVYYDRSGLAQEGTSAYLGWSRVDVSRRKGGGLFHPKVVLLLVERKPLEQGQPALKSLIIGISSANITRHGWWENVEAGHLMELPADGQPHSRTAYREDVLAVLEQLKRSLPKGRDEPVLDAITRFAKTQTNKQGFEQRTVKGRFRTRIYVGQAKFADWLAERGVGTDYNLEVISPFFDKGDARTLGHLIEMTQPKRVRVYLPVDAEGVACVHLETFDAIAALPNTSWARLPDELVKRSGNAKAARLSPRGVHAKVYRFWHAERGEVVVAGSVNLTRPAHSIAKAGNLEVAVLVDQTKQHRPVWWMRLDKEERKAFVVDGENDENEGLKTVPLDVSVEFDWQTTTLQVRAGKRGVEVAFRDPTGKPLFEHEVAEADAWEPVSKAAAKVVCESLPASSFLIARLDGDKEWRILVRELNCGFKPSVFSQLTPEEILQYWALLTPEQQHAYILDKLRDEKGDDGLAIGSRTQRFLGGASLFQRFSGVFHAFGCLRRAIEAALEAERPEEAEIRLFGNAYDSLPQLLSRLALQPSEDVARDYVTVLCTKQLRDYMRRQHPEFWHERKPLHKRLNDPLKALEPLVEQLGLGPKEQGSFLEWYEKAFLADVGPKQESV